MIPTTIQQTSYVALRKLPILAIQLGKIHKLIKPPLCSKD